MSLKNWNKIPKKVYLKRICKGGPPLLYLWVQVPPHLRGRYKMKLNLFRDKSTISRGHRAPLRAHGEQILKAQDRSFQMMGIPST